MGEINTQAVQQGVPAAFVLKADVETNDDVKLAILELRSLTGHEPQVLASGTPSRLQISKSAIADARRLATDDYHILIGVAPGDPSTLARRLALIESIVIDQDPSNMILKTDQTSFERSIGALGVKAKSLAGVSRRKNEYLSHSFHKYKAKFFPRMARSLANFTIPTGGRILDPFMGSGTLAIEASLMGIDVHGIDVDPLSVEIARTKTDALRIPTAELRKAIEHVMFVASPITQGTMPLHAVQESSVRYELPSFIAKKIDPSSLRDEIEENITRLRMGVETCPSDDGRRFLRLALSHAISTKISLRWMGTGDNRFALSVAKRPVDRIMIGHLQKMLRGLEQRDILVAEGNIDPSSFGNVTITAGDVRALPYLDESFDGIVTSPPYIPASSGRETYLRSRACSLTALGLSTEEEILAKEEEMMGSILRGAPARSPGLPDSIADLVEWMMPQRARQPKALATAAYFLDMRESLREMARVTKIGGKLAIVVSSEHVFYDLITREIVRRLDMPSTITEIVNEKSNLIPLDIDQVIKIQLPKMDYAARPASNGAYSEAIVLATRR